MNLLFVVFLTFSICLVQLISAGSLQILHPSPAEACDIGKSCIVEWLKFPEYVPNSRYTVEIFSSKGDHHVPVNVLGKGINLDRFDNDRFSFTITAGTFNPGYYYIRFINVKSAEVIYSSPFRVQQTPKTY